MKLFFFLILLSFFSYSCASGDARSDFCKSSRMTFNTTNISKEYTESYSFISNFDTEIQELSRYGDISFTVTQSDILNESGNISWVKNITIDMVGADDQDKFPQILFAKSESVSSKDNKITLKPVVSDKDITKYLKHGDTIFIVFVTGMIPDKAQINNEMCLHAGININKSLF